MLKKSELLELLTSYENKRAQEKAHKLVQFMDECMTNTPSSRENSEYVEHFKVHRQFFLLGAYSKHLSQVPKEAWSSHLTSQQKAQIESDAHEYACDAVIMDEEERRNLKSGRMHADAIKTVVRLATNRIRYLEDVEYALSEFRKIEDGTEAALAIITFVYEITGRRFTQINLMRKVFGRENFSSAIDPNSLAYQFKRALACYKTILKIVTHNLKTEYLIDHAYTCIHHQRELLKKSLELQKIPVKEYLKDPICEYANLTSLLDILKPHLTFGFQDFLSFLDKNQHKGQLCLTGIQEKIHSTKQQINTFQDKIQISYLDYLTKPENAYLESEHGYFLYQLDQMLHFYVKPRLPIHDGPSPRLKLKSIPRCDAQTENTLKSSTNYQVIAINENMLNSSQNDKVVGINEIINESDKMRVVFELCTLISDLVNHRETVLGKRKNLMLQNKTEIVEPVIKSEVITWSDIELRTARKVKIGTINFDASELCFPEMACSRNIKLPVFGNITLEDDSEKITDFFEHQKSQALCVENKDLIYSLRENCETQLQEIFAEMELSDVFQEPNLNVGLEEMEKKMSSEQSKMTAHSFSTDNVEATDRKEANDFPVLYDKRDVTQSKIAWISTPSPTMNRPSARPDTKKDIKRFVLREYEISQLVCIYNNIQRHYHILQGLFTNKDIKFRDLEVLVKSCNRNLIIPGIFQGFQLICFSGGSHFKAYIPNTHKLWPKVDQFKYTNDRVFDLTPDEMTSIDAWDHSKERRKGRPLGYWGVDRCIKAFERAGITMERIESALDEHRKLNLNSKIF